MELLVVAALLTLTVSRALLGVFQEQFPETVFPRERWAKTFRSVARLILEDVAQSVGYPPPNLAELLFVPVVLGEEFVESAFAIGWKDFTFDARHGLVAGCKKTCGLGFGVTTLG